MANVTKATFGLTDDAMSYLRSESSRRGVSMADILRQAISTDEYINKLTQSGADLIVEEKGKPKTRLVIKR
jgi:hypothetical protein